MVSVVKMANIDFDQETPLAVDNRGSRQHGRTRRRDNRKSRPILIPADRALFRLEFAREHYR